MAYRLPTFVKIVGTHRAAAVPYRKIRLPSPSDDGAAAGACTGAGAVGNDAVKSLVDVPTPTDSTASVMNKKNIQCTQNLRKINNHNT